MDIIKYKSIGYTYQKTKTLRIWQIFCKKLIEKYKNYKILEFVDYITLSIMDGSIVKYDRQSDYYKLVMSFIVIPSKIFKKKC